MFSFLCRVRYIELNREDQQELQKRYECSQNNVERQRSYCLLLSHQGYTINDIINLLEISRRTIERLFNSWEQERYRSLKTKSGRGAKIKLANLEEVVHQQIEQHNRNLDKIINYIRINHNVIVSKSTLKRFLKS